MKTELLFFEPRHAAAAAELERLCFSDPWSERQLADASASGLYRMFAAECGGELAGYCGFQYVPDEGYITNVAVFPRFRRMGVGDALVAHMCAYGQSIGLELLTLEVRLGNIPAQKLYEKHGFVPVGTRRGFYTQPTEDALLMTKYYKR